MNLMLPLLPDKEALKKFVSDIFRNLLAIYIILLAFSFVSPGYVEFYIDLNKLLYLLIVLGAGSLLFYAERLEKSDRNRFDVTKKRITYAFLGLLLILAVHSIAPQAALEGVKTPLMVAAVALGAITFYLNRDKLGEIEDEARQEEVEEKRREMEFAGRYPRVNRVWGVRWAARWMYKEGWWYGGCLVFIIVIYSFIVFYKLGNYGFQADEILHALIAKNWFENHELFKIAENYHYYRGALISILAILSKTIFPYLNNEFAYRLPVAFFGIVNVVLIYTLSKKIVNKNISLFIVLIFATDIWFIEFARYLRFYTPSITIILFLLIYLINKNFSMRALIFSFCLSIGFYFLLVEYFVFIAFFVAVILLNKIWFETKNLFY